MHGAPSAARDFNERRRRRLRERPLGRDTPVCGAGHRLIGTIALDKISRRAKPLPIGVGLRQRNGRSEVISKGPVERVADVAACHVIMTHMARTGICWAVRLGVRTPTSWA